MMVTPHLAMQMARGLLKIISETSQVLAIHPLPSASSRQDQIYDQAHLQRE
jgi:hypothetical protein